MYLTLFSIQNAKARAKPYKLADGDGLHLLVNPNGSKLWRLRYRFGGKQNMLALGSFPEITLASARTKREDARRLVAEGIDPSQQRKNDKVAANIAAMESTIHTLVDLMDDPTRTDEKKGPALTDSKFAPFIGRLDDVSRRFFQNEFFSSNYRETRQQIKARIYGVLQHPEFLRMFEARERKLDMFDCLQNRSIVLVNTGMNTMGGDASQLLGRYIIALTLNAAFARFTIPREQWHQAHLIIDEFQEFADDEKTPELLRLAREYKLAVTLAHQEMHGAGMTEKVRSAVSTNTTVKFASRPEGVDINYVARDMRCDPSFLTQQTKTATHARFACFVRGLLDHPVSLTVPFGNIGREPQMSKQAHRRLLNANALLLSSPKQDTTVLSKSPQPQPLPPTAPPPIADTHPTAADQPEAGKEW